MTAQRIHQMDQPLTLLCVPAKMTLGREQKLSKCRIDSHLSFRYAQMPIYADWWFITLVQHSGHSRTIIGYEENARGDINLLLFDPGK